MGRVHLFEFEDQEWFPGFLRNYMTDFLQFLSNATRMYEPILPLMKEGVRNSRSNQIIDLASGGGGGLLWINKVLKQDVPDLKLLITDYYPNIVAFKRTQAEASNIDYLGYPVDARNVPGALRGLRTQFLSMHHFRPSDARQILQNAVDHSSPILIIEAQERSLSSLIAMFLSPLTVLFTTPFIRPVTAGRLIFTYLIPAVPFFVWWDGIVSAVRTYSVREMWAVIDRVKDKDRFDWKVGKLRSGPGTLLYLLGTVRRH